MGHVPSGCKYPTFSRKGVMEPLVTFENSALELDIVGIYLPYFYES